MEQTALKRIPNEQVTAKTGKGWDEWFDIIDSFGLEKGHTAIAKHLREEHGVDDWYAQAVTIQYEKEHGARELHQRGQTYEITFQRTVSVPVEKAFEAFSTAEGLNAWFTTGSVVDLHVGGRYSTADGDTGEFKKVEPNQRLVFTWEQPQHAPGSSVEVLFEDRGDRCVVNLTHRKLGSKADADDLKTGSWNWALDSLKSYLETGSGVKYEDWKASR